MAAILQRGNVGGSRRSRFRRVAFLLVGLLAAYLTMLVLMMWFEESLVFFPIRYPGGNWQPRGLDYEDVWFTAADNVRLHGWYCPNPAASAVVLFAHGNAGNLSHRAEALRMLHKCGAEVLIFDYRGYGQSEGRPNEAGILQDARAARAWLAGRAAVPEKEVVLFGESLGGAVMVDLAACDGARGLILQSTFPSLPEVAARHYPWVPVRLLMRTELNSLAKIDRYQGPVLQSHGDDDRIVPYELGQKLFTAANEPKRFFTIRGGDHNDFPPPEYYAAVKEFLGALPEHAKAQSTGKDRGAAAHAK
jgi:fermentation-respiration switch protein FrsA (DUF1100 family)